MRRDELLAAVGRAVAAARARSDRWMPEPARRAWGVARANPDRVIAVVMTLGVVAIVLHWR